MHHALQIQEILFNIFGHCSCDQNADLVALSRTCRTFKEPALDVLWEELRDPSPLARCLPDVCCSSEIGTRYTFRRPLNQVEWNILRGYARRVWSLHTIFFGTGSLDQVAFEAIFTMVPLVGPLFPNLRAFFWKGAAIFPLGHIAVPSLITLELDFESLPPKIPIPIGGLDTIMKCCPDIKRFFVRFPSGSLYLETAISSQVRHWTKLRYLTCYNIALSVDTILQLSSLSALTSLRCHVRDDVQVHIPQSGPVHIFGSLFGLEMRCRYLGPITSLLSRIRLPVIKDLDVSIFKYTPKRNVEEYWAAVRNACPSHALSQLMFYSSTHGMGNSLDPIGLVPSDWLTLDDFLPYKNFGNLAVIALNVAWSVKLTDADVLEVVSASPQVRELSINCAWGWRVDGNGGGITLSGLVELLRRCPFLTQTALAIESRTFTRIPLNLSFPPRALQIDLLDTYITPALVLGLAVVFNALKLEDFYASVYPRWDFAEGEDASALWQRVRYIWQHLRYWQSDDSDPTNAEDYLSDYLSFCMP